jgi:hypothetical protein
LNSETENRNDPQLHVIDCSRVIHGNTVRGFMGLTLSIARRINEAVASIKKKIIAKV